MLRNKILFIILFLLSIAFSYRTYSQGIDATLNLPLGVSTVNGYDLTEHDFCYFDDPANVVTPPVIFPLEPITQFEIEVFGPGQFTFLPCAGEPFDYGIATVLVSGTATPTPSPTPTPTGTPTPTPTTSPTPTPTPPCFEPVKSYFFAHSLIYHGSQIAARDETSVPHWLALMDGNFSAAGQFGFTPQVPATNQLDWLHVPHAWDTGVSFADTDFTHNFMTVLNFALFSPPPSQDVINAVSWVNAQEEGVKHYVYEAWPDFAGYVAEWPPSESDFDNYNIFTLATNTPWYQTMMAEINAQHPNVVIIPVATVLAQLFQGVLTDIPVLSLYEDGAPHGTETTYLLAAMIVYQKVYGLVSPPIDLPSSIHPVLRDNFGQVAYEINRLLNEYGN